MRFQPRVTPPQSGFTRTVRSPLSQLRRNRPVCPARYFSSPRESSVTLVPARRAMASKISPVADSPASTPVNAGCTLPGTTPQTPGTRVDSFCIAMRQVEVPTTLTTSPSLQPAPIASQCASNAPTGKSVPGRKLIFFAHSGERCPASLSEVRYSPPSFSRTPSNNGSTFDKNSCGGRPPQRGFQSHLWPMAHTLRFTVCGSFTPQSVAAAISQFSRAVANLPRCSGLCRSQCSSFANPHSEEYTPPHH